MDLATSKDYIRTTNVNYLCALSKKVRAGLEIIPSHQNLRAMVEALVDQFENSAELCASLKVYPNKGSRVMRQVDIRPEPGHPTILLKTFISWDYVHQAWFVMVEGPDETVFENNEKNY